MARLSRRPAKMNSSYSKKEGLHVYVMAAYGNVKTALGKGKATQGNVKISIGRMHKAA